MRASAAVSTTTVQGTVYLANGQPGSGMLHVSWPAFTTANGQAIVADSADVTIGQDGFLSVNLAPNQGAMPGGLYYTAVFYMSDGSASTQYWVVPAASQATLAQVQVQVMPAAQAVQAVNKAYVDDAIAQVNQTIALVSQSELTGSGGTLTGPLFLSGDPTQPLQAADKHYVDLAVTQSGSNNVNPASPGQIAYYAQNGTSVNGMSTVPLTAGGTGSSSAAEALQNLGGISATASATQTMAGPLNLSAPYDLNTTNLMQAATEQNVRNVAPRSVKEFGAKGNGIFSDFKIAAGSDVVQLVDAFPGYMFQPGDVGKLISLPAVDSDHKTLYTTITGYTDSTHVTVANAATYAFDGTGTWTNQAIWASDDLAAINAAIYAVSNLGPGAGSARGGIAQVYFPCGIYAVSNQISIGVDVLLKGETSNCVNVMYMGTGTADATIEVASNVNTYAPILRQNVFLTNTNHPEIGGCTGSACSPTQILMPYRAGSMRDVAVYGSKNTSYAVSLLQVGGYTADSLAMYGGSAGCFYTLNDVQTTFSNLNCQRDLFYGLGAPVNGIYVDGSGSGEGPIPMMIQSPNISWGTGTALTFNMTGGAQVSDAQVTMNNRSLNVTNSSGNLVFEGNLFEAATTPDIVAGGSNEFIATQFTGNALNITGTNNHFRGGGAGASSTINISGANTLLDGVSIATPSQIVDTSKTTQIRSLSSYGGIGFPITRYAMDQSTTANAFSFDGVVHARGNFIVTNTNTTILSPQFSPGQAWKAIFIGDWFFLGGTNPDLPGYLELTDTNNTATDGTYTVTFSLSSSGYFQAIANTGGAQSGFVGDIFFIPRGVPAGSGGTRSMQLSNDLAIPSIRLAGGTAMTGNHGAGVSVQHSDGTGTSGAAFFTADGSVTATAGSLQNGVTATTQSTGDNSAKVATTAYVAAPGAIAPTTVTASGMISGGNDTIRTSATTIGTTAFTSTGLVLPTVPANTTKSGHCIMLWQMSSTSYSATFGVGMSNAPTGLWGGSFVTFAATGTSNWLAFAQATTAVTAVSTATTVESANTTYRAEFDFTLQTGASNPVAVTLYGQVSQSGATLTIEPGSTCYWLP
jgi:hypothetical protein